MHNNPKEKDTKYLHGCDGETSFNICTDILYKFSNWILNFEPEEPKWKRYEMETLVSKPFYKYNVKKKYYTELSCE